MVPRSVHSEVSAKRSASAWLLATCHPVPFRSAERRARLVVASAVPCTYHEHVVAVAAIEIVHVAQPIAQHEEHEESSQHVEMLGLSVSASAYRVL